MTRTQVAADSETPETAKALVPPRPNLGPEPLPESPSGQLAGLLIPLTVLITLAIVWRVWRRRRAKAGISGRSPESIAASRASEPLPGEQLVTLAERARASLIEQFGEHWRAKTTEEIAMESDFLSAIDPRASAILLTLLKRADVEKFAARPASDQGDFAPLLEAWESSLSDFFKAGARSTIKGK